MPSSYTPLKIELIANGEQSGTWGTTTNTNLGTAIEEALVHTALVTFSGADITLTLIDSNVSQIARNFRLNLLGTSGGARNLTVPAIEKNYLVVNNLADTVTIKNATGTGVAIPAGRTVFVYNDGINVSQAFDYTPTLNAASATVNNLTLTTPLSAASGGTTLSSFTAGGAVYASSATALTTGTLPITAGGTGQTGTPANGELLIGNSNTGGFTKTTLTAGTGVNITNGPGSITFTSTGLAIGGPLGTPSSGNLVNCTADGTNGVGYINVPINSQSISYTTVLGDAGKAILHPTTDTNVRTFNIPSNVAVPYALGTVLTFINMTSQVVTIGIINDTMFLAGSGSTGNRSLSQYGMATAIKITSTTWLISGTGLT